jgi:hypothetical protein
MNGMRAEKEQTLHKAIKRMKKEPMWNWLSVGNPM